MSAIPSLAILQATPGVQELQHIVWAQWTMAAATALIALIALGAAFLGVSTFRSLARLLRLMETTMEELAPRAHPLVEGLARVTQDASELTANLRTDLGELRATMHDANGATRALIAEAEARVRRLGAVLDVVQAETEDILVKATATVRGVHATAEALTGAASRPLPQGGTEFDDEEL